MDQSRQTKPPSHRLVRTARRVGPPQQVEDPSPPAAVQEDPPSSPGLQFQTPRTPIEARQAFDQLFLK